MATLPFLLLTAIICRLWIDHLDKKIAKAKEIIRLCNQQERNETNSKPKYKMKNVDPEDDELFLTDNGNFDEAFRL